MEDKLDLRDPEMVHKPQTEQEPQADDQPLDLKRYLIETFQTILLALVLYFAIDAVVARVRVENISMEPTLVPGDFLLVNKLAYRMGDVEHGDVIVFHYPVNPQDDYIKRAIGIPGDTVRVDNGVVYVNNQVVNEAYIMSDPSYNGEWVVPIDSVFALGDNRNLSSDSHSWGYVPIENLVGKAFFVYWPPSKMKPLNQVMEFEGNQD